MRPARQPEDVARTRIAVQLQLLTLPGQRCQEHHARRHDRKLQGAPQAMANTQPASTALVMCPPCFVTWLVKRALIGSCLAAFWPVSLSRRSMRCCVRSINTSSWSGGLMAQQRRCCRLCAACRGPSRCTLADLQIVLQRLFSKICPFT